MPSPGLFWERQRWGFGASLWFVVVHHRWPAAIGAVLWAILGAVTFLHLWTETERSSK